MKKMNLKEGIHTRKKKKELEIGLQTRSAVIGIETGVKTEGANLAHQRNVTAEGPELQTGGLHSAVKGTSAIVVDVQSNNMEAIT